MQPQTEKDLIDVIIQLQNRLEIVEKSLTNDAVPIGAILEWPGPTSLLPFNYLPADGRAVDRVAYASYFAQVGTSFGAGDGSTTFNIAERGPRVFIEAGDNRSGCVACDGTSFLRATYPDLFNALGGASSPWGLPDGTHFNVPDLRGRGPIGAGTGVGLTGRTLGTVNIGEETHQLTVAELASHTHVLTGGFATTVFTAQVAAGGSFAAVNGVATNPATNSTGSDTPHNNMQPSSVFNFFIETTNSMAVKVL